MCSRYLAKHLSLLIKSLFVEDREDIFIYRRHRAADDDFTGLEIFQWPAASFCQTIEVFFIKQFHFYTSRDQTTVWP